ncbi:hypothetical protein [Entomobacter blattae]|uniref:hypothetical protein n=1 Tax=Entomobacter blattae TaxID=2762277 RepID=UPI00193C0492|nr:hypothetical protein [Entomobacter blattae]
MPSQKIFLVSLVPPIPFPKAQGYTPENPHPSERNLRVESLDITCSSPSSQQECP